MNVILQADLEKLVQDHSTAFKTQGKYGDIVDLFQSDLCHRNFVDLDLRGARMQRCLFHKCFFDSVDFSRGDFLGSDFTGSKFSDVNFDGATLLNTKFEKCTFENCSFEGIKQGVMDYREFIRVSKQSDKIVNG